MSTMSKEDFLNKTFILQFFKLSLLTVTILLIASYVMYCSKTTITLQNLEKNEINKLQLQVNEITQDFNMVKRDLLFIQSLASSTKLFNCNKGRETNTLKEDIYKFIEHQEIYSQIKILNNNGLELIKCNYNNNTLPSFVPDSLLVDKSHRYYYQEMKSLDIGDLYFSKFDLNIENKKIEIPFNQVLRAGCKISNCIGETTGYLILNYQGNDLVKRIKDLNINSPSNIHLLDPDGYFLISPNIENNWGFMFDDKKDNTYAHIYPNAWKDIKVANNGQIINKYGIFTFNTLNFRNINSKTTNEINYFSTDEYWKVVSFVPALKLEALKKEILTAYFQPVILLVLLALFTSFILAYYRSKNIEYNQKIQCINKDLQIANHELENLDNIKNDFLAIISHEINTPLNGILGFTNVLKDELKSSELIDFVKLLEESANRLLSFSKLSLRITELRTQKDSFIKKPILLNQVLGLCSLKLSSKLNDKKIHLNIEDSPENFTIQGDPTLILYSLEKIIKNAIQHSKENSSIDVKLSTQNHQIICKVIDEGEGFSEYALNNLFKLFASDKEKTDKNKGLELALIKLIMEVHNADIKITNNPDKGATVTLIFNI